MSPIEPCVDSPGDLPSVRTRRCRARISSTCRTKLSGIQTHRHTGFRFMNRGSASRMSNGSSQPSAGWTSPNSNRRIYLSGGNQVAVPVDLEATVKHTGKTQSTGDSPLDVWRRREGQPVLPLHRSTRLRARCTTSKATGCQPARASSCHPATTKSAAHSWGPQTMTRRPRSGADGGDRDGEGRDASCPSE